MGSERLSHIFAHKDPTYQEKASITENDKNKRSSSHQSISHMSGTHPVSISNGEKSSVSFSSASLLMKTTEKENSKYNRLLKLFSRQLINIETTLNAIHLLSKPIDDDGNETLLPFKNRFEKLNENLKILRNSSSTQDQEHSDQMKNDIEQIINDLQLYKMNNHDSTNVIDFLVDIPVNASNNEESENNNEENAMTHL